MSTRYDTHKYPRTISFQQSSVPTITEDGRFCYAIHLLLPHTDERSFRDSPPTYHLCCTSYVAKDAIRTDTTLPTRTHATHATSLLSATPTTSPDCAIPFLRPSLFPCAPCAESKQTILPYFQGVTTNLPCKQVDRKDYTLCETRTCPPAQKKEGGGGDATSKQLSPVCNSFVLLLNVVSECHPLYPQYNKMVMRDVLVPCVGASSALIRFRSSVK